MFLLPQKLLCKVIKFLGKGGVAWDVRDTNKENFTSKLTIRSLVRMTD